MLITAIEKHRTTVVTELKQKQEEAETRAKELLRELEQEINDLQTRNSELQHLELTQNPLHLLQVRSMNYMSASLYSDNKKQSTQEYVCVFLF